MTTKNELIVDINNNVFHNMYSNSSTPSAIIGYNNSTGNLVLTKGNTFLTPIMTINNIRITINDIMNFGIITNTLPSNGDVWFDGINFNFRAGGMTNIFKTQLLQLNDISISSLVNNDILVYKTNTNTWNNYHLTGAIYDDILKTISVIPSIGASSDVNIDTISGGNILVYNAIDSAWENYTVSGVTYNNTSKSMIVTPQSLSTLSDIYLYSLSSNNLLIYDNGINKWENYSFDGVSFDNVRKIITITPSVSSNVQSGILIINDGTASVAYSSPYTFPPNLSYIKNGVASNDAIISITNPTISGFDITISGTTLQNRNYFNYFSIDDISSTSDNILNITRTPTGNLAVTFSHSMGNGTMNLIYVESLDIYGNGWKTPNIITTTIGYVNMLSNYFVTNISYVDGFPMIVTYNNYILSRYNSTSYMGTTWDSPIIMANISTTNEIYCFINGKTKPYIFAGSSNNNSYLIYGNDKYGTSFTTVTITTPHIITSWVKGIILKSGYPGILFQDTYTGGTTNIIYWYMDTEITLNSSTIILNDISNQSLKILQCDMILVDNRPAIVYYYTFGSTQVRFKIGGDFNGTSFGSYKLVLDLSGYANSTVFGVNYGTLNLDMSSLGMIYAGSNIVVVLFLVYSGVIGTQTFAGENIYYTRCYTVRSTDFGDTWESPIYVSNVPFYVSTINGVTMQPKLEYIDDDTIIILYLNNTNQIIDGLKVSISGTGGKIIWTASDKSTNYNTISFNATTDVIKTNGDIYFDGINFNFVENGITKKIKINLSELNDVSLSSNISSDNLLVYNPIYGKWDNYSLSGVIFNDVNKTITFSQSTLSSLPDISISGLSNNNMLIYNTVIGKWRNYTLSGGIILDNNLKTVTINLPSVNTCTDILLSSLGNNQLLIYNNVLGKWKNYSLIGPNVIYDDISKTINVAAPSIATCSDVIFNGISTGDILQWTGTTWTNLNALSQSFITGLTTTLASKIPVSYIDIPNGICPLDSSGYVPSSNLGNLVTSINSLTGSIILSPGTGMSVSTIGNTVIINNLSYKLETLNDCSIISPANDSLIVYNSNQSKWLNYRVTGAIFNDIAQTVTFLYPSISNSSDVLLSSLTANNFLQFNGSKWVNISNIPQNMIANLTSDLATRVLTSSVGIANGICPLNGQSIIPSQYLSGVVYTLNGLSNNITITVGAGLNITTLGNTLTLTNTVSSVSLAALSDCSIVTPSPGNFLVYNNISSKWTNYSSVGLGFDHVQNIISLSAISISGCTDVTLSSLNNNNILVFHSTDNKWENYTVNGAVFNDITKTLTLSGTTFLANLLSDVLISSPANDDILRYSSTSAKWQNSNSLSSLENSVSGINNVLLSTQTSPCTVLSVFQNQIIQTSFSDAINGFIIFINNVSASIIRPTNFLIGGVGGQWSSSMSGGTLNGVQTASVIISNLYDGSNTTGVYISTSTGSTFMRLNFLFPLAFNLQDIYLVYSFSNITITFNLQILGSNNSNDFNNITNITTGMTSILSVSGISSAIYNNSIAVNATSAYNIYTMLFTYTISAANFLYITDCIFVRSIGGIAGLISDTDFSISSNSTTGYPDILYINSTTQNISYNFTNLVIYEAYRRMFPVIRSTSNIKIGTWNITDSSGTYTMNNGSTKFSISPSGNTTITGDLSISGNFYWGGITSIPLISTIFNNVTGLNQSLTTTNNIIVSVSVITNSNTVTSYDDVSNGPFVFINNLSASVIKPSNIAIGGVNNMWSNSINTTAWTFNGDQAVATTITKLYDSLTTTGLFINPNTGPSYIRINFYFPQAFVPYRLYFKYLYLGSTVTPQAYNIQLYASTSMTDFNNQTSVSAGMTLIYNTTGSAVISFDQTFEIDSVNSYNVYSIFLQSYGGQYLEIVECQFLQQPGSFSGFNEGTDFTVSTHATNGYPVITYNNAQAQTITYNLNNLLLFEAYRRLYKVVRDSSTIILGIWTIYDVSGTLTFVSSSGIRMTIASSGNTMMGGNVSVTGDLTLTGNIFWSGNQSINTILNSVTVIHNNLPLYMNINEIFNMTQNTSYVPTYIDAINGPFMFVNDVTSFQYSPSNISFGGTTGVWTASPSNLTTAAALITAINDDTSTLYISTNTSSAPYIRINLYYALTFCVNTLHIYYGYGSFAMIHNFQLYGSTNTTDFNDSSSSAAGMTLLYNSTEGAALAHNVTYSISSLINCNVYSIFLQGGGSSFKMFELNLTKIPQTYNYLKDTVDFTISTDSTTGYPQITYINPTSQAVTCSMNNILLYEAYRRIYPVVRSSSSIILGTTTPWTINNNAGTLQFNTSMMTLSTSGNLSIAGNLTVTGTCPSITKLSDVSISSPSIGNLLYYDSSLSKWKNFSIGLNTQILSVNTSIAGSNLQWVTNRSSYAHAYSTSISYNLTLSANTYVQISQPFTTSSISNFTVSGTSMSVTYTGSITTIFKIEFCISAAVTSGTDTFKLVIQKNSGGTITQISSKNIFTSTTPSNATIVTISSLLQNDIVYITATNFTATGSAILTIYECSLTLTVP